MNRLFVLTAFVALLATALVISSHEPRVSVESTSSNLVPFHDSVIYKTMKVELGCEEPAKAPTTAGTRKCSITAQANCACVSSRSGENNALIWICSKCTKGCDTNTEKCNL